MPQKKNRPVATNRSLSRREQKDLDVTIGFLEGIVRRDPGYVDALQLLGDDYTRRGRLLDGLEVDERLSRLCPGDPLVHYNLACSYTLNGSIEDALAALDQAIKLGYRDFKWMARDPDLKKLREHPAYKDLEARVRQIKVKLR